MEGRKGVSQRIRQSQGQSFTRKAEAEYLHESTGQKSIWYYEFDDYFHHHCDVLSFSASD
ncbi:hypothetical protein Avbf_11816 [Armadillidium vulgare]|nr:hypothetical protein Avbf_11816 [Armadillidium vulgare]